MKQKKRIYVEIALGVLFIFTAVFLTKPGDDSIWPKSRIAVDSGNRQVMGTIAKIIVVAMDEKIAKNAIEAAFRKIDSLEDQMSVYKPDSMISGLNENGFNEPVKVSEELFYVIQSSIEFSKKTDGAFDITVGPLIELWKEAGKKNELPEPAQIEEAKKSIGYEKLILNPDENTIQFAVEGMKIDLGAIAKGFAIDKAAEEIMKAGAIGGLIDIGGDIRCFGAPPKLKKNWMVGLQNPKNIQGNDAKQVLLTLSLFSNSVATSGNYQRYVEIDGKRFSHIIDPHKYSSADDLQSVSVIAATSIDSDALATSVSVLGKERGLELIESLADVEAVIIPAGADQEMIMSSGMKDLLEK